MVAWSPGKIQGLSELCKSRPHSSLFNHFHEQNLKHGRCSMNVWVNKECTWKMLETLGCGKEFNMHSSQFPKGRESKRMVCSGTSRGQPGRQNSRGNKAGKKYQSGFLVHQYQESWRTGFGKQVGTKWGLVIGKHDHTADVCSQDLPWVPTSLGLNCHLHWE